MTSTAFTVYVIYRGDALSRASHYIFYNIMESSLRPRRPAAAGKKTTIQVRLFIRKQGFSVVVA